MTIRAMFCSELDLYRIIIYPNFFFGPFTSAFFGMAICLLELVFKGSFLMPRRPNFSLIFLGSILRMLLELTFIESWAFFPCKRYGLELFASLRFFVTSSSTRPV